MERRVVDCAETVQEKERGVRLNVVQLNTRLPRVMDNTPPVPVVLGVESGIPDSLGPEKARKLEEAPHILWPGGVAEALDEVTSVAVGVVAEDETQRAVDDEAHKERVQGVVLLEGGAEGRRIDPFTAQVEEGEEKLDDVRSLMDEDVTPLHSEPGAER